jgi:hypothetical protein
LQIRLYVDAGHQTLAGQQFHQARQDGQVVVFAELGSEDALAIDEAPIRELCPREQSSVLPGAQRGLCLELAGTGSCGFWAFPSRRWTRCAQEISGFLGDGVEDGQIKRLGSDGQAVEHGTQDRFQHLLALRNVQRGNIR